MNPLLIVAIVAWSVSGALACLILSNNNKLSWALKGLVYGPLAIPYVLKEKSQEK